MKRIVDFLAASVLLVLFGPLMLLVALAVALDSHGGAVYRQTRIGLGGAPFQIIKFRSMVTDADRIGGHSTATGDVRITRVGRWIRKTSLDELPQLINVLTGEMSLVGPRPDTPMQEKDYTAGDWQKRCSVRPGITGLAQATLRSSATPEERLKYDLEYVDKASLSLDFKIIVLTVKQVLFRGGN